jgi:hypothetical protein
VDNITEQTIEAEETPRTHYAMIPHIVDDMGLSPHAYRLYGHFRRVIGENGGKCWQSTATIAEHCKMSAGMVSKVKRELEAAGLVRIKEKRGRGTIYHIVTLVDIWTRNAEHAEMLRSSPSEGARSPDESARSQGETKKNPSEEEPGTVDTIVSTAASQAAPSGDSKAQGAGEERKSPLEPDTDKARAAFERLRANAKARGRRGPRKFPTLECKAKFDAAAEQLNGEFDKALQKALEQGRTSVTSLTNYIAAWARNARQSNVMRVGV